MTVDAARAVADAVLYEGYLLYPYRASATKNRSRWQFGVLMPPAYPDEPARMVTECVLEYTADTTVDLLPRFLQVQRRTSAGHPAWEEAVECEFALRFPLPGGGVEALRVDGGDHAAGGVRRWRHPLEATLTVSGTLLDGPVPALRLHIELANRTVLRPPPTRRAEALPGALVAAHLIASVHSGAFVSMVDSPDWAAAAVRACVNQGAWPVLAGPPGTRDTLLASPIILPDHPGIAPQSPGDLYDATEIEEILTLRTLALTEDEKREVRATDPRAAALLDRVESMDGPTLAGLHGTMRPVSGSGTGLVGLAGPDRAGGEGAPWWDPGVDASVSPDTDTVDIGGVPVGRGSTVRLCPGTRRADAQDMFLAGRPARVEAVLLDVDDRPYLAVTLVDDPGADLRRSHGRFLYFAPDEVEALP